MIEIFKNSVLFLFLILLQVIVINHIDVSIYMSPLIIVLFVLALPFKTPLWVLLIASFLLGLMVDMFMNTPGILSFSLVFVAYLRPFILNLLQPRDGYFSGSRPNVKDLGWIWYFQFSIIITFVFHLVYFIILGMSHDHLLVMIWKSIISTLFALAIIYLFQLLTTRN